MVAAGESSSGKDANAPEEDAPDDEQPQDTVAGTEKLAIPKKLQKPESAKSEGKQSSPTTESTAEEELADSPDEAPAKKLERRIKKMQDCSLAERRQEKRGRETKTKEAANGKQPPAEVPQPPAAGTMTVNTTTDVDDFGLPVRKAAAIRYSSEEPEEETARPRKWSLNRRSTSRSDASRSRASSRASSASRRRWSLRSGGNEDGGKMQDIPAKTDGAADTIEEEPRTPMPPKTRDASSSPVLSKTDTRTSNDSKSKRYTKDFATEHAREASMASNNAAPNTLSEFSHQKLTTEKHEEDKGTDDGWQTMPAFAPYDMYDDDNRLIAREHEEEEEENGDTGHGGAGKGYTRVFVDDDAESATSMDDNTQYLFKATAGTSMLEDEEEQRDAVSQMEATKDLLTEGQRIAYVGITRLHLSDMIKELENIVPPKRLRKQLLFATESTKMWSQKMMVRLYAHMDINVAEQVMIEQLAEHGVQPSDLTPALMANSRVKNPMAGEKSATGSVSSPKVPQSPATVDSPTKSGPLPDFADEEPAEPPPPYQEHEGEELPDVRTPSQLPTTSKIDIDLRWTVLCDLFLVLIADSVYDSRSRVLLERVGQCLDVPPMDICKFERKVTEALEMQQNAEKENWDEKDHMETRRKLALKRRYVMMGLATVGGGLVIGLSAGLLAPVIGAGLAAGFTTIGVTGTSSFLAGAGGAAIITSSAAASGSVIGGRAANRRTGAVKTFEYRPLHNNKRVNLIVTVSGWMTGKVDDVRLPFSTVDPVMGDIYSVLWEPEMLTSMGDTINILATEALTQGLQQILGSTILISLMAALQLPVVLTKLSYLIDNPWAVSLDRATMAGLILADSLIDRNLGTRPITLVGYSLGSRVIFSCLKELARKGAFGIVQNVFLFGSPIVVKRDEYLRARTVVAGRFVNGYNRNDWILGYLFRLTNGGIRRVAGLGSVDDVPAVENMDVTEFVVGHMDYRTAMPRLLREAGWLVESDEFSEIEDPDPENHAQRQRELINEIEEARKELEKESKAKKGGAFSKFFRKKKEKQEWEIYEEAANKGQGQGQKQVGGIEDAEGNNHGVLFDVDAIRAELAKERGGKLDDVQLEQLQVRELESTLPPMKLDLTPTGSPALTPPARATSRQSFKSPRGSLSNLSGTDSPIPYRISQDYRPSASSLSLAEQRTPTLPGTTSFGYERPTTNIRSASYTVTGNEGISMTFDSSFDDVRPKTAIESKPAASPTPPTPVTQHATGPFASARNESYVKPAGATAGGLAVGAAAGTAGATAAEGVKERSPTLPAITLSDPWADEDDEDFGKEKEISMTFA